MLAAFLMLLFLEAVLSRRGAVAVALTLWLAGITKETALPFLLVLAAVVLFGRGGTKVRTVRRQLVGLAAGAVLAFASNAAFNLFRFDSIWNTYNLRPLLRVPGVERRIRIAVSIWAAPNGGLLVFWPLAVLLGIVSIAWALRRQGGTGLPRWPAVVLLGVAAWLTAGFASWFSPFGWFAWGPRLELPWVPALLVLTTVIYPHRARVVAQWVFATTPRRIGAALVVTVAALPHLAALFPPDPLFRFFATDSTCPVTPAIETASRDYFYRCTIDHWAWHKTPVWLDALSGLGNHTGLRLALLLVCSCVASFLLAPRMPAPRRLYGAFGSR